MGGPFSCTEICLKDVPEMGYRHTDTWHGSDPRDGAEGGIPCGGRGEVRVFFVRFFSCCGFVCFWVVCVFFFFGLSVKEC